MPNTPGARCHLCFHLFKRFKYLRRHARTVHAVPRCGELNYVRAAKAFRARRPQLERNMGMAPAAAAEDVRTGTDTPPRFEYEVLPSDEDESDEDGGTPRRKRVTKEDLEGSGFLPNLDSRCPGTRKFEQLLTEVTGVTAATAARKAGVLHRYLHFNRAREPDYDDVERLTRYHVALNTMQEYRTYFSPRSVVVLADAARSCCNMLQYCRPLQDCFNYTPERHRDAVIAATAMWTQQRSKANKEAALKQRYDAPFFFPPGAFHIPSPHT